MMNETRFQTVYIKYKSEITYYLVGMLHNAQDAEDLVQECFIRLMNVSSEISEEKLRPYLYKIAYNLAIDCFRKRHRLKKQFNKAYFSAFHYDISELEIQENVDEITSLVKNQGHREILELRLIHGYSVKETAVLVDKSERLIRMSLFHAKMHIRNRTGLNTENRKMAHSHQCYQFNLPRTN
ncbi:hypothetical protein BBD42_24735 [Paenibacillus sp. BIHB 4019]|uniref:RNA polymerase sigma-70 region 2 domain-containing protein n=1 Tax=Paenibacillus sp. BIHB 4019 TaxID=1870819 RepID=A0A1B2DNR5_9BACL|nr:RNA polymerase sigma factor [Paenibacillus sp. BIHB 4019]ANY69331.1 hypothetical protein BBD42_24735 [Paenibacillus sp. BIHB 4019]